MDLANLVHAYLGIAGQFDRPVPISRLGLRKEDLEGTLSVFDEDYQISRYMHLSHPSETGAASYELYRINGFEYSHVSFHFGVQQLV
jgi:hypothetical protein